MSANSLSSGRAACITAAACQQFKGVGRVEVSQFRYLKQQGVDAATVRVTTLHEVLLYDAYSDDWSVCFTARGIEPLNGLPLFEAL